MLRKIDALFAYFTLAIFYFNVDKCLKPQKKRLIKILLENYKKQLADRMAREKVTSMGGDKSNRSEEF